MPASVFQGPLPIRRSHLFGVLLLSLATLVLELALTRVLSVTLWYHFGFLVISTALLGFGASGVTLALWSSLRNTADLDRVLSLCSLAFAVSTILCFFRMQHTPFDPFSIAVDHRQLYIMPIYFVLVAVPFFCSGLGISLLLTRGAHAVTRLYAYDLVGAGLGCGLITVILPYLGGAGSVFAAAAIGALASVSFALPVPRRDLMVASAVVGLTLIGASVGADRIVPIHVSANKLTRPLKPIYRAWNTLSLVDVEETPAAAGQLGERRMIIDAGTAATGIQDLRPGAREVILHRPELIEDDSAIVYPGRSAARVLIIGSGGGSQVLEALKMKAASITAVEINPTINDIVANRMNDYWGGLFHQPEVHLVTDEGRSFLRRSPERFDAIISVHTISNAAVASGALSLAENYVLTREAFDDYLDHLTPNGILFFTRPEAQIARLLATARESFAARKLGSVHDHAFAFVELSSGPRTSRRRGAVSGRGSFSAGFLLQKARFTPEQLKTVIQTLEAQARVNASQLKILYSPYAAAEEPPSIYQQLANTPDLQAVYRAYDTQLAPATDDKPFFNQHTRWSRIGWHTVVDTFSQDAAGGARMALEDRPIAEITVVVLLLQSILVAGVCILLPLLVLHRGPLGGGQPVSWLAYFAALGLGFIMVEIALLQRFLLFLGQPIYTYAVVLAGLLIFTGVGSWTAGRSAATSTRLRGALMVALISVLLVSLLTAPVFHLFLGSPLFVRIFISVLLVAPLGFALGRPFPLGLRVAAETNDSLAAWAWGVNGFFTVIGTVLALMLGMMVGFRIVLVLAGLCYLAALLAISWIASSRDRTATGTLVQVAGTP